MNSEEAKKRKACQSCTKAKAKCSPFENRVDVCHRCHRLKKECIFDDTVRKRGPKQRSRVKQLEQRVDTLIDLLANGQASKASSTATTTANSSAFPSNAVVPLVTPPESATYPESHMHALNSETRDTPLHKHDKYFPPEEPCPIFDPVEAGLLDDSLADSLLCEYRESYAPAFPFIIIPPSTNARLLREGKPFLLHAVLTATLHRNPALQMKLAAELQNQIALRVIRHSHKSLELLQGMLLFTGWYQFYYDIVKQQQGTILQLCVAMVQDLGLSKNSPDARKRLAAVEGGKASYSTRTLDENRAFLGTFCLNSALSQAWRKRTSMSHTRYMDQCCEHLARCQEYASDALIAPLTQLSALICRVNDYFSYDDIESGEVKGEALVSMSATNFESELNRLEQSVPASLIENSQTLRLGFCLLRIWINECAVHSSLWRTSDGPPVNNISTARLKVLYRCQDAVKSYIKMIIAVPQTETYHLAFPSWSAWCYACIVGCKLVFLEDERGQQIEIAETFSEISRMVTDKSLVAEPSLRALPTRTMSSTWDPVAVAQEIEILSLFKAMFNKMKFTLPDDYKAGFDDFKTNPLSRVAYFQRNILCSLTNRLNEHIATLAGADNGLTLGTEMNGIVQGQTWAASESKWRTRVPLLQNLHFNSINFDSIAPPEDFEDGSFSEWLWNTAMDDFTMPPL